MFNMKHNFDKNYTKILQKVEKFPQIEKKTEIFTN